MSELFTFYKAFILLYDFWYIYNSSIHGHKDRRETWISRLSLTIAKQFCFNGNKKKQATCNATQIKQQLFRTLKIRGRRHFGINPLLPFKVVNAGHFYRLHNVCLLLAESVPLSQKKKGRNLCQTAWGDTTLFGKVFFLDENLNDSLAVFKTETVSKLLSVCETLRGQRHRFLHSLPTFDFKPHPTLTIS